MGGGDRTVDDEPLCVVTKAYHLRVFLSLANLNIQKEFKAFKQKKRKS